MKKILITVLMTIFCAAIAGAVNCGGSFGTCQCGETVMANVVLTSDLNCAGNGLIIGNNGITLDCADHIISGPGVNSDFEGIYVSNKNNVHIQNCHVTNYKYGIRLYHADNGFVEDNVIISNSNGLYMTYSSGNTIQDNQVFFNTGDGIYLGYLDDDNLVEDNAIVGNNYGVRIGSTNGGSDNNELARNTVSNNNYGIQLDSGIGNMMYRNYFMDNTFLNAYEETNSNSWDNSMVGNSWDDFQNGPGSNGEYEVPGPGDGIDHYAWGNGCFRRMGGLLICRVAVEPRPGMGR
ncbi:MAG: right-handed parallel beta-helix repeat-containing protein [Nanoarchaeota archaeon]|nr:right-handed parallel beta-helix repeat-containing protein [Nanoarchaeota archaeon]